MVKRTASALLWFVAVAWGFNFLSAYAGFPQVVGFLAAVAVALFVGVDPLHLIWPASAAETRIRDAAAPKAAQVPGRI